MKPIKAIILYGWLLVTAGCHLEQGKIYFDELGLDPITVYKMAPLERTVFCLAESDDASGYDLGRMHANALARLEASPENADWSELVCLALHKEAGTGQIRETINALTLILAVQPKINHPARGFKLILEQRLELLERIVAEQQSCKATIAGNAAASAKDISACTLRESAQKAQLAELQEKIGTLEQQVRKLKEVELILHPKEP